MTNAARGEREAVFLARKGALCQLLASVLAGGMFVCCKLDYREAAAGEGVAC